jgi:parallel beta-helix repeat protein
LEKNLEIHHVRLLEFLFLSCLSLHGLSTNYYVGPEGSNNNDHGTGLSQDKPFLTIQYAFLKVMPGDTVFLMNGTYRNQGFGTGNLNNPTLLEINRSGTEGAPITLCNLPGHKPILEYDGRSAIRGNNLSHIEISGLEIRGNADRITMEEALAHRQDNPRKNYYANFGIILGHVHHININHCKITYSTGSGIIVSNCDYITIERNEVGHNTFFHTTAMCGIEVANPKSIDTSDETKIILRENMVYDNQNKIPFFDINLFWSHFPDGFGSPDYPYILDGHGILIFNYPEEAHSNQWFHGRILVENNLCFGNGFNGIKINRIERADIRGNILYKNGVTPRDLHDIRIPTNGIYVNLSSDVTIRDNIIWAMGMQTASIKTYQSDDLVITSNKINHSRIMLIEVKNVEGLDTGEVISWRELNNGVLGNNWVYPIFTNPSLDWNTCDFSLTGDKKLSLDSAYFNTPKSRISSALSWGRSGMPITKQQE